MAVSTVACARMMVELAPALAMLVMGPCCARGSPQRRRTADAATPTVPRVSGLQFADEALRTPASIDYLRLLGELDESDLQRWRVIDGGHSYGCKGEVRELMAEVGRGVSAPVGTAEAIDKIASQVPLGAEDARGTSPCNE